MNQLHKVIGLYGNIPNQLLNHVPLDPSYINTYEKYTQIYKVRHDLIHSLICDQFSVEFGEKTVEKSLEEAKIDATTLRYYNEIKEQTPDYLFFNRAQRTCMMFEVSVSRSQETRRHKMSKYALLSHFITKELKFNLNYKVFIFFPLDIYRDRPQLLTMGLTDPILDTANNICKNAEILLSKVHETNEGQLYFSTFNDILEEGIQLNFNKIDVINTFNQEEYKSTFMNQQQFDSVLRGSKTNTLIIDKFMDSLIPVVEECQPELLIQPKKFSEASFWTYMESRSTSKFIRSIMPLPYIRMTIIDSATRSTLDDLDVIRRISAKMISSGDPVLSAIGESASSYFSHKVVNNNDDLIFPCKLSPDVMRNIALEGPGRKKYIRMNSKPHIETQKKHNGYALSPNVDISDIERIIKLLSNKALLVETGEIFSNVDSILNSRGQGLDYIRICQSIYREININAMRGDRRRNFVLKPTGVRGVNILLYPGPKMRSGEMVNLVWFKVIIERELHLDSDLSDHWVFKALHPSNQILHSDWLSTDVHRLDHYIRCFDKILMVYCSFLSLKTREYSVLEFIEKKGFNEEEDFISMMTDRDDLFDMMKNQSLVGLYNSDKTDALGLITMIYLEDRRSTSKLLQQLRYLFMTSISITPQYDAVFQKMSEPIRSPLQLYLLKCSISFHNKMKLWRPKGNCIFGRIRYDQKTQVLNDTFGGSILLFPRMIIKPDGLTSFHEILCEMYFTMLFNKNQDDPTHASFQVLDKIIEGEESFRESKKEGMIYGEDNGDDIEYAKRIIRKPHLHQFSRKAIEIGSKLLRNDHMDPLHDEIKRACLSRNVNKTLDDFATYKSTATMNYTTYDPKILRQNQRTKCVNAVMSLLRENLSTSFDVVEKYKHEKTFYQVFKKNQIGGVREILILPITNRIRINVLETISRNICKTDSREILTHGNTKNDSIKSLLHRSKKYTDLRCPIHITFDKSKWGPSFIPIQFMYLFTNFKEQMGPLYYFVLDLLIRHQRKVCLMPDRLVKAWYLDQDNLHKHKYTSLQNVKNKFLMDKDLRFLNESNMGQGILHFTSSYLHLSMISFRNELYKRVCKKRKWTYDDHEDLLSSDDSYTLFSPELTKSSNSFVKLKLKIFLACQEISEKLFNCRTSLNKSSINPFIGEFNSLFISNMSFIPTLIKFSLSSVHPVNTDSFFRMVKESYSSSRQIVENGGTMDLYLLSHKLNKIYCESIYHSHEGGYNDRHKLDLNIIPYQMGEYPIFNPALMLIFGPEYYNYKLFKRYWDDMTPLERRFYKNCHKVIKGDIVETMGEFEDGDTILGGLIRIEACIGPVKQLENFRRTAILTEGEMREMIMEDPLIIIKQAKTLEEVKFKTCQKLYTNGSKEAVKILAASIFYGRVSATVSAKVFRIPGVDERMTYLECLKKVLEEPEIENFDEQMKFLYPTYKEYDLFLDKERFVFDYKKRHPLEIQTVQKLTTHKIRTRLVNSIPILLEYHWGIKPIPIGDENKVLRDVEILNIHYGLLKPSLELTCEQFSGSKEEKVKKLLMLILKLYRLKDRSFKGIMYGVSSEDIFKTYLNLLEKNATQGFTTRINKDLIIKHVARSYEEMFCAYNCDLLRLLNGLNPIYLPLIDHSIIDNYLSDPSVSRNQKKRIFMMAVSSDEHVKDIESWSERTSTIVHYWKQKQTYYEGKYQGDFELCLFSGFRKLLLKYNGISKRYNIYYQMEDDPELLYTYLQESSDILQMDILEITNNAGSGQFICLDKKIIKTSGLGFNMMESNIKFQIPYKSCKLEIVDEKIRLMNWDSYKNTSILNIELGLLPTTFVPDGKFDFICYNMSFIKMCKIGAFDHNFNSSNIPKEEALDCLDDLKIMEPSISESTLSKFPKIPFSGTVFKYDDIDSKVEILGSDISIAGFADVDISDLKAEDFEYDDQRLDDILGYISTTDLINILNVSTKIIHTKKILNIVKNLKYELITYMFSTKVRLSSKIINAVYKMLSDSDPSIRLSIIKSLICIYDRQESTPGAITPENVDFSVYKKFDIKFDLKI